MLIILPNEKGHFLNYVDIIKKHSSSDVEVLVVPRQSLSGLWGMLRVLKSIAAKDVVFLHGEQQVLLMLLLRICRIDVSIKSVFYYGLYGSAFTRRFSVWWLLNVFEVLKINVFGLEASEGLLPKKMLGKITPLNDPVLLNIPEVFISDQPGDFDIECLLYGYLDDRKSIPEIISALEKYGRKKTLKIKLNLLGAQSQEVSQFLEGEQCSLKFLKIYENKYRFSSDELVVAINNADLVFAVYKNHVGSSGVVMESVLFNKNVLFVPVGVLKGFADELAIQPDFLVSSVTEDSIETAVGNIVDSNRVVYSDVAREHFLNKRTVENFCQKLDLK